MKQKTYAIVGGGIGGLTLAIALQQKGYAVTVYENAPAIKPLGAGIVLAGNAMKAFTAIGLDQQVLKAGKEMKEFVIFDQQGKTLSRANAEKINATFGVVNTLTLHRADLHAVLLNELFPGTVLLDKNCIDFKQEHDQLKLFFGDGSTASADAVIAADGIHSVFRKRLLPSVDLRYSGYTCWRAVIDQQPGGFNNAVASETWGAGLRFGTVPLSNNRVYWFATADAPMKDAGMAAVTPDLLGDMFKDFHEPIEKIIRQTKQAQLIHNDIMDFAPVKQFAFGPIVLMGDAAHATTPNLGQGACMAIEDAVILANCISKSHDVKTAFMNFERQRIERTTKIVNTSFTLGKVGQFKNPLLVKIRNVGMRLTPERVAEKQLKFLYDISFA